jgi:ubiquinone biosynthesis monooxygenase Coq7
MLDRLIVEFDKGLRTVLAPAATVRPVPGADLPEAELSDQERRHATGLMRVNHVGEICAQALYQGQALTSRDTRVRTALQQAAREETEHLAWTEQRIAALGGRKSLFNPLWYLGALGIGVMAGRFGDGANLGFLAETERQVEAHLEHHETRLPATDARSLAVVAQMKADEASHAQLAETLGAHPLPAPVKRLMGFAADIMRTVAYRL